MAEARAIAASKVDLGQALPYTMLFDDGGIIIVIGIPADANVQQVRATLVKAADEHQDDYGRDYLWFEYFFVSARLMRDGRQSEEFAGELRRHFPPNHPMYAGSRLDPDSFVMTLEKARETLR